MAGLANPPGFGNTEWDESYWGAALGMNGPRFTVAGPGAWRPSVSTTQDRTINIAPGQGTVAGGAVFDSTNGDSVRCDPNLTNSIRYDIVVARWNWTSRTRTFVVIKGSTAGGPQLNLGPGVVEDGQVNRVVGSIYDGAIALIPVRPGVGIFSPADLTDLRLWMQGADLRIGSNFLTYADLAVNSNVITPDGEVTFNGSPTGVIQNRTNNRRWDWGSRSGYSWTVSSGNWNLAPGSQGLLTPIAGHTYQIISRFTVGNAGNQNFLWRFSQQIGRSPLSNTVYGQILEETDGAVGGSGTYPTITMVSHYYADTNTPVYIAGFFAVSGPVGVSNNFSSPCTTILDQGPTPPFLFTPGL